MDDSQPIYPRCGICIVTQLRSCWARELTIDLPTIGVGEFLCIVVFQLYFCVFTASGVIVPTLSGLHQTTLTGSDRQYYHTTTAIITL